LVETRTLWRDFGVIDKQKQAEIIGKTQKGDFFDLFIINKLQEKSEIIVVNFLDFGSSTGHQIIL